MSKTLKLTVSQREVIGKKVAALRRSGLVIGNIFSRGNQSTKRIRSKTKRAQCCIKKITTSCQKTSEVEALIFTSFPNPGLKPFSYPRLKPFSNPRLKPWAGQKNRPSFHDGRFKIYQRQFSNPLQKE